MTADPGLCSTYRAAITSLGVKDDVQLRGLSWGISCRPLHTEGPLRLGQTQSSRRDANELDSPGQQALDDWERTALEVDDGGRPSGAEAPTSETNGYDISLDIRSGNPDRGRVAGGHAGANRRDTELTWIVSTSWPTTLLRRSVPPESLASTPPNRVAGHSCSGAARCHRVRVPVM